MIKIFKNENGLSLVELLAVLAISTIIIGFSTSLIVQAMNNQERITIEANLRDEADIIMAHLTKAIFTLKESEIEKVECGTLTGTSKQLVSCITDEPNLSTSNAALVTNAKSIMKNCTNNSDCTTFALIILKDNKGKIGFEGNTIFTKNESYTLNNKHLKLQPYLTIEQKIEPYSTNNSTLNAERISNRISFTLEHSIKKTSRTYQNEVLTVDDI